MHKFKRGLFLFLAIFLSSCSGGKILENGAANPLQTFNIEKEFSQFQERPIEQKTELFATEKKTEIPTPVKNNKVAKLPLIQKKQILPAPAPASDTIAVDKPLYPKDLPEEFITLSKRYQDLWPSFSPRFPDNEVINLKVKFLGMTVGHFLLKVMPKVMMGNRMAYVFKGHLKSESYYEMLYKLDDIVESYVDAESFVPIKFLLTQRESNKLLDELHLFDLDKFTFNYWYKRVKGGQTKEHQLNGFLPKYFQDFLSSIYFLRGLPLKTGDHYEFPSFNKGKITISKVNVVGEETLQIGGKTYKSIKVKASNNFPGQKESKGDLEFWFSNDEKRTLLQLKGNVKIGNIEAELAP